MEEVQKSVDQLRVGYRTKQEVRGRPSRYTTEKTYLPIGQHQETNQKYNQCRRNVRPLPHSIASTSCSFATITPNEILRDRLVFGIRDVKARERLLRETKLTLEKTDEICHAAESMLAQLKVVEDSTSSSVNAVNSENTQQRTTAKEDGNTRECWNCGRKHGFQKRELCPAYGKTCNKCHKPNHFAAKCRSKTNAKAVKAIEENNEIYQTNIPGTNIDDSQFVTLQLESGNYLRFQVDTGAQCNVVPMDLYKKATKDYKLSNVTPCQHIITAYGGTSIPIVGQAIIRLWRGNSSCRLDCKIVDRRNIRLILGRKACIGMKIVD